MAEGLCCIKLGMKQEAVFKIYASCAAVLVARQLNCNGSYHAVKM